MEGRESTETFDFDFGPMKEYLDVLRTLTLKGKAFHVFSFQKWNRQLRLVEGCYSGKNGVVSELLKFGGIPHHPRVSSWPLHALLEARASWVAAVQKKGILEGRRLLRRW